MKLVFSSKVVVRLMQTLRAALVASQSVTQSPTPPAAATAAVPQPAIKLSPATEHPSPHVISQDCYMVVDNDDNDANAILDLSAFVLGDVMMADDQEITDDHLLI